MSNGKNFQLNYDPERNMKNIFARKLQQPLPQAEKEFSSNPFTKLMQPVEVTKSKRFVRDKLNISDIQGTKPEPYKISKKYDGREYMEIEDIPGAKPVQLKQAREPNHIDYKLFTKDINPDKWVSHKNVDPLNPQYQMKTKSGRMMIIGEVEDSKPKSKISPQTRRLANFTEDIQGTKPKRLNAVNDEQRSRLSPESDYGKRQRVIQNSRQNQQRSEITYSRTENTSEMRPQGQGSFGSPVQQLNTSNGLTSAYQRFSSIQNSNNNNNGNPSPQQVYGHSPNTTVDYSSLPPKSKNMNGGGKGQFLYEQRKQQNFEIGSRRIQKPNDNQLTSKRLQYQKNMYNVDKVNQSVELKPQGPQHQMGGMNHNSSSDLNNNSPVIQDRVWSKAREVGKEIVNNLGDMRITQNQTTNVHDKHVNLPNKYNFEQNIYERGLRMNSGHKSNSFSQILGSGNPINNEVTFKADNIFQSYQNQNSGVSSQKRDPRNSLINPITSLVDSHKPMANDTPQYQQVKSFIPPTTQKAYGSFLDSSKIDQMINQLKQQKGQQSTGIF